MRLAADGFALDKNVERAVFAAPLPTHRLVYNIEWTCIFHLPARIDTNPIWTLQTYLTSEWVRCNYDGICVNCELWLISIQAYAKQELLFEIHSHKNTESCQTPRRTAHNSEFRGLNEMKYCKKFNAVRLMFAANSMHRASSTGLNRASKPDGRGLHTNGTISHMHSLPCHLRVFHPCV